MNQVTTIGLDIAKSIFQLHGVDAAGRSVLAAEIVAKPSAGVLWQTATMSDWPRGLRVVTLLGSRVDQARS
jgi:hypothetical protein